MTQNNEAFEKWWHSSKYMQVVFSDNRTKRVALDGYEAATQASESEINSLKQRVADLEAYDLMQKSKLITQRVQITELTASNNQFREALEKTYEKLKLHLSGSREYLGGIPTQVLFPMIENALSSTPEQSLAEHDNEVTAPYKKALEFAEYLAKSTEQFMIAINQLDAADQEEDEATVEIMQEKRGEHWRAVNSSIYEFRQRSDRALRASHG